MNTATRAKPIHRAWVPCRPCHLTVLLDRLVDTRTALDGPGGGRYQSAMFTNIPFPIRLS